MRHLAVFVVIVLAGLVSSAGGANLDAQKAQSRKQHEQHLKTIREAPGIFKMHDLCRIARKGGKFTLTSNLPDDIAKGQQVRIKVEGLNDIVVVQAMARGGYLAHFLPNARISDVHGQAMNVRGRLIVAMYHPAAALHQPSLKRTIEEDFARLPDLIAKAMRSRPDEMTAPAEADEKQITQPELMPAEKNFYFLVLGSGTGSVLHYFDQKFPFGMFHGVETAPVPFVISWLRSKIGKAQFQVKNRSMWQVDLSRYDVVYAFLSPQPMIALAKSATRNAAREYFYQQQFCRAGRHSCS